MIPSRPGILRGVEDVVAQEREAVSERTAGAFRLVIGAGCGAVYALFADASVTVSWLFWSVLAVGMAYSAWNVLGGPPPRIAWFQWLRRVPVATTIKAILLMLVLYATGAVESPLFVVIYFAIVVVAFRCSLYETILAAAIYSVAYMALAAWVGELAANLPAIAIRVGFMLLTAAMAGRMSAEIIERRVQHELRTRWVERAIQVQDQERRRIARELHDGTGQSLASLAVGLRALEESSSLEVAKRNARKLRHAAEDTVADVARLARGLHPSALDDLGFAVALRRFVEDYAITHGIEAHVCMRGEVDASLPQSVATALYRIVQEALTNVVKHARASEVSIVIDHQPDRIRALVEDDGRGFAREAMGRQSGLGLQGIKERLALIHGSLTIESVDGGGATLAIDIPLGEAA